MSTFSISRFLCLAVGFPGLSSFAFGSETSATIDPPTPLPALVETITAQHPELKFYEEEIAAARARRRTAGRMADPELSVSLGHKRVRDPNGLELGDGTAWSVSLMQSFDWSSRLDLRKAIANQDIELAELGLARFQHALAARVRVLALSLDAAQARAAAVREVAGRFTTLRETWLAREPAGITPLLETRVIEAAELTLQRRSTAAELDLSAALIELNQLRGAAPDAPLRLAIHGVNFHDAPDRATLLAAAPENNFSYRLRRAELAQQGFSARLGRYESTPTVSAGPFFSQENAGGKETVIGISVSVPLPVTGRMRSAADLAAVRERQAVNAAFVAGRELEKEVLVTAETFAAKLAETRRWSPDATAKFREAAELADRHYRLGAVPIATYLEIQQSYLDAVEALLDTRREAVTAGLKLEELTGLNLHAAEVLP